MFGSGCFVPFDGGGGGLGQWSADQKWIFPGGRSSTQYAQGVREGGASNPSLALCFGCDFAGVGLDAMVAWKTCPGTTMGERDFVLAAFLLVILKILLHETVPTKRCTLHNRPIGGVL